MEGLWTVLILFTCVAIGTSVETEVNAYKDKNLSENNDPQRCMSQKGNNKLVRFEVLPGGGWDNLRNKDVGMIIRHNYSLCKTTDDGQYLIPDGINTVPMKTSKMESYAELFEHWNNYTSTTSTTINVGGGLQIGHFGIGGKFSHESESIRSKQVFDESVTTRVQLRYVRYTANLQPDTALEETFKSRLLKIASLLQLNNTELARYESQLVVRDFGTHVITSVDAGGALVQLDQIKRSFMRTDKIDKTKVLASASASFFSVFRIGASYQHSTSKELIDQYENSRTHSAIETYGGPTYKPQNFSLNDWTDGLEENLVALDRSGDPIFYLITPTMFPELPPSVVYRLTETVKNAVQLYYKYNTYLGCTRKDSPNFSFQANVDDGSCESPTNNYTFGGVYQTCTQSGNFPSNLCEGLEQKNPLKGGYSCPEGYEEVLIDSGSKTASKSEHRCHRCYLLFHCCDDHSFYGSAEYKAYWCAATGTVKKDSGFLFGGLYTSTLGNLLTSSRSCPLYFYPLKMSKDLHICVSDDYELAFEYSVPFAGFFSCTAGNPLKLSADNAVRQLQSTRSSSLGKYLKNSGANHWPRGCPQGFSEHLAQVANGCEINYCIQSHALSGRRLPIVRRPPFISLPSTGYQDEDSYKISSDGLKWTKLTGMSDDPTNEKTRQGNSINSSAGLSQGGVAAISIFVTLACVAIVALLVAKRNKRKAKESPGYKRLTGDQTHLYGTHNNTQGIDVEIQS